MSPVEIWLIMYLRSFGKFQLMFCFIHFFYDFELYFTGYHVTGWRVATKKSVAKIERALKEVLHNTL